MKGARTAGGHRQPPEWLPYSNTNVPVSLQVLTRFARKRVAGDANEAHSRDGCRAIELGDVNAEALEGALWYGR
ncbi:MAG: hypothetical protein NVSMB64_10580 [Candidatus Velthaea sp.]